MTNTIRITALALLGSLSLLGCSNDTSNATPVAGSGKEPTTFIGKAVKEATDGAREELAKENIDISATGYPNAEISPAGELLIDGKAIAVNAEQKALLIEYRQHIVKVAEAGIGVGLEGADLAGKALTEAIKGIFSGNPDQIEKKIETEAESIRISAGKLCALLPAMKVTQDKLAAALPEFRPYATMDDSDVEECMTDNDNYTAGEDVGRQIGQAIKDESTGSDDSMNAAEEAEAASARQ